MNNNTEIYMLVNSLTKSEKRYFSLFAKRHVLGSENEYVTFFRTICFTSNCNDEIIKHKLNVQGQNIKIFKSKKRQLFGLIMKSLTHFHMNGDILKDVFNYSKLLLAVEKNLLNEASGIIASLKDSLYLNENYILLLDVLNIEVSILHKNPEVEGFFKQLSSILNEKKRVLSLVVLDTKLQRIHNELYYLTLISTKINYSTLKAKVKFLLKNKTLNEQQKFASVSSLSYTLRINSAGHYLLGDLKKSFQARKKLADSLINNPRYSTAKPEEFFVALYNCIGAALSSKQQKIAEVYLQVFEQSIGSIGARNKNHYLMMFYPIKISYYLEFKYYKSGLKFLQENGTMENFTIRSKDDLHRVITTWYLILLHYHTGNIRKVNYLLNLLVGGKKPDRLFEFIRVAHVLRLIIAFEQDKLSRFKEIYKECVELKYVFSSENFLSEFCSILFEIISNRSDTILINGSYKKLRKCIGKASNSQSGKRIFEFFDFSEWLKKNMHITSVRSFN